MDKELALKLKRTLENGIYDDLVEWMNKQLRDLKNIENVREYSKAVDQSIELKAQLKAYYKLDAILTTIIAIKNMPEPEEKENEYGVEEEK